MVLQHTLDLSRRISIRWLRGVQIHDIVATVPKFRGPHPIYRGLQRTYDIDNCVIFFLGTVQWHIICNILSEVC
jgi:hypothetical protein